MTQRAEYAERFEKFSMLKKKKKRLTRKERFQVTILNNNNNCTISAEIP